MSRLMAHQWLHFCTGCDVLHQWHWFACEKSRGSRTELQPCIVVPSMLAESGEAYVLPYPSELMEITGLVMC